MANALASLFGDIANAIREKTGETETMAPSEFPDKISGIETGGGGLLPAGVYYEADGIRPPNKYRQTRFFFNGDTYVLHSSTAGSTGNKVIVKYVDGSWTEVLPVTSLGTNMSSVIEYDGKMYIYGNDYKYIFTFDNMNTLTQLAEFPGKIPSRAMVVFNNTLYAYSSSDGGLYAYDKNSDTWALEATIAAKNQYCYPCVVNGELWFEQGNKLYKYSNGTVEQKATLSYSDSGCIVSHNNCIYWVSIDYGVYQLRKYDPTIGEEIGLGHIPTAMGRDCFGRLWVGNGCLRHTLNESNDAKSDVLEFIIHVIE